MFHEIEKEMRRNVLVVDDEEINRQMLGFILRTEYNVLYAENGQEALDLLKTNTSEVSAVLLDIMMPVMNGFQLIELLKADEELRRIPIIVMTSEQTAELQSLRLGAADFIKKPYDMPEIIMARVQRIIELAEERSIIQATENDELTGLYTKEFFMRYTERLQQFHGDSAMDAVTLDIEHFHILNERRGRAFGDRVLQCIAECVRRFVLQVGGIGCRYGDDLFCLICWHQEDYTPLLTDIQKKVLDMPEHVRVRVRMGVYANVDTSLEVERQFDCAKMACDSIRGDHTRIVAAYDLEMHRNEVFQETLINDIHRAMEESQILVYFQPKYSILGETPVLSSAEGLVRWRHPEYGMISPGVFIPLFEQNGLIQQLDHYVWRETARQIRRWKDALGVSIPVSVNVSRIDLYDPALYDNLRAIRQEFDVEAHEILLEVTESACASDTEQLVEVLEGLRSMGFLIEMDDFGSGYSSLNMLTVLPVDILKMDMSFVRRMQQEPKNRRIIEMVVEIAELLGTPVIAEGVENEDQYQILKEIGCDVIQGYYFSRPLPADDFLELLSKQLPLNTQ